MAEVLRGRGCGCDVQLAAIGFTDARYAGRFKEFPMPHPFRELVTMPARRSSHREGGEQAGLRTADLRAPQSAAHRGRPPARRA